MTNNFTARRFLTILVLIVASCGFVVKAQDKLKAEEIISKHLDSIGIKETREKIKNRVIIGSSLFSILRASSGAASGRVVLFSEDRKNFWGTNFDAAAYPFEKISFDNDKVNVAFISPGNHSPLGNFILAHKLIFSEGLFSGSLSSAWSLLDLDSRKAKVKSAGKKKIEGREVYAVEYLPGGGSDLEIKMYFDAQTFRHVRTEYRQTISAAQGLKPDDSVRQVESRHQLTEDFSDYREENGLTLPHSYRVYLSLAGANGTNEFEWKFEFSQFLFNQKLDAKSFDVNVE